MGCMKHGMCVHQASKPTRKVPLPWLLQDRRHYFPPCLTAVEGSDTLSMLMNCLSWLAAAHAPAPAKKPAAKPAAKASTPGPEAAKKPAAKAGTPGPEAAKKPAAKAPAPTGRRLLAARMPLPADTHHSKAESNPAEGDISRTSSDFSFAMALRLLLLLLMLLRDRSAALQEEFPLVAKLHG